MESLDETNDNNMIIDYVEPVDDSYIKAEDKKQLLIIIKNIYETRMPWADQILMKCMIKEHYNAYYSIPYPFYDERSMIVFLFQFFHL